MDDLQSLNNTNSRTVQSIDDVQLNGADTEKSPENAMQFQDGGEANILVDWTWTYRYVTDHADRAVMFAVLGFAIGAILLLVFLIVRLLAVRRRAPRKFAPSTSPSSTSATTTERHHDLQHQQPQPQKQYLQQQQQQHSKSSSLPSDHSESVVLLSSVSHSPPGVAVSNGSGYIYNPSSLSRNNNRRRPDRVHFAPPTQTELATASGADRSHGTSFTDDVMTSPASTETSLNDVFLPASTSTPGPIEQVSRHQVASAVVVNRPWQTSADVVDDHLDDVDVGTLIRNDTARGSFYSNPYRHDTIDGRIRTSRAK